MKTKIVLIGSGNVATHVALQLCSKGYEILQVYSRTEDAAKKLAKQVNADYTANLRDISNMADFYVFSVKDAALEEVIANMPHSDGIWLHTSGSMPLSVFDTKGENFGVLYPIQTFSKERAIDWTAIPLFIESSDQETYNKITELARSLSDKIYPLTSDKRKYIHLSAVFACNFVNHMYEIAGKIVEKSDLPFDILLPLIEETCKKVYTLTPYQAQTGPAVRYDKNIITKHIELLGKEESLLSDVYKLLSESIHQSHKDD